MSVNPAAFQAVASIASQTIAGQGVTAQLATSPDPTASSAFALDTDASDVRYRLVVTGGAAALALAGLPGSAAAQETQATTGARDPFCEAQDATMGRMQHEANQFNQMIFGGGALLGLVVGLVVGRIWGRRSAAKKFQQALQVPTPKGGIGPKIGE